MTAPLRLLSLLTGASVALLLSGCGPSSTAASPSSTSGLAAATSAATSAAAEPPAAAAGTAACHLISQDEATKAIGSPAGAGTPAGTAALSHCVWADGSLEITVFANGTAQYGALAARLAAQPKSSWDKVEGLGSAGFVTHGGPLAMVFFLHGTSFVNIMLTGPGATARPDAAVAAAHAAAGRL